MALITKSRDFEKMGNKEVKPTLKVSDLLIPLLGLTVFILLTIFVYIPSISQAMDMRAEINDIKVQKQHVDELNLKLSEQDVAAYSDDYLSLTTILPIKLQVANFAYYVDKLAIDTGLTLDEIRASDASAITSPTSTTSSIPLFEGKKVSGPVKYNGKYEKIVLFLDQLQSFSPYLISIDSLKIAKIGDSVLNEDKWSIEMTVSAVYYGVSAEKSVDYTKYQFSPYSANEQSLYLLKNRAAKIQSSTK
jgi:Tfp pilus assembly protein PilO